MASKKPPMAESSDKKSDDTVTRWLKEIEDASDAEREWRELGEKIIKRFRDDRSQSEPETSRFNMLYANTDLLMGVMYQQTPKPDVRRRFRDRDPVARVATEVLNRALTFSMDSYDFDSIISSCVQDRLLPGRGVLRAKYVPTMGKREFEGEDGQTEVVEEVTYEEVCCEYQEWKWFRMSPARSWDKVRWIAFGDLLSRDDLKAQFPDVASEVRLNWTPNEMSDDAEHRDKERMQRALVWTIWDKTTRKVYVICGGYTAAPLKEQDDPLRLERFFPIPKPLTAITTSGNMIPVPDYQQYKDQAVELDILTQRISVLADAMRRRGVYNANYAELAELAELGDNKFIAVQNFAEMASNGGIQNAFAELPIENIAKIITQLMEQRERVKQTIYEVTGISDIFRGSTAASETAEAQSIKEKYGTVRIKPRQNAIANFLRDLLCIQAEIISEHFSKETLMQITGIQLPTPEQKQVAQMQYQQQIMMAQQQQQPPPPPPAVLDIPTWDDVMKLLRDDKLRGFRIDIETNSTIAQDDAEERKQITELLQGIGVMIQGMGPAVESGVLPMEAAKSILLSAVRKFKIDPQIEEQLEAAGNQPPPQKQEPQDNSLQVAQLETQAEQQRMQLELQFKQQQAQAEMQLEQAKMQAEQQKATMEMQFEQQKLQIEMQAAQQAEELKAQTQLQVAQIKAESDYRIANMEAQITAQIESAKIAATPAPAAPEPQKDDTASEALGVGLQAVAAAMSGAKKVVRDQNGTLIGVEPA